MGSRGPQATPTEKLKARGSWRAAAREKSARTKHGDRQWGKRAKWVDLTEEELHKLIREIPGYDPFALQKGCRFNPERANRALRFFPEQLCHIEGAMAGRPFKLERWQQAFIANLEGWERWSPKWRRWVRRFREALLYVPRKNGKTPLIAGVGLKVLLDDEEQGQQDYLAGATREQAGKLFRYAKAMVAATPALSAKCRVYGGTAQAGQAKSIVKLPEETSFLQVIAADADAQHGGTSYLVIVEELHTQTNRELVDTLATSLASENRAESLLLFVTTADFNRPSICNEKHDYACKVRDGIIPDPSFLPVIYEALPDKDDWTSEEVWRRVNPNLGVSVSLAYLRAECLKAQQNPALENTFKRLHLNMKTETDVRAIPMGAWDAIEGAVQVEDGAECYAGLDLSTTTDLTAFVLWFPDDEGGGDVLPFLWAPEENARQREKRDRVPYLSWAQQGLLKLTPGNVIDYDVIRADINALRERFNVREIAADRWNATQIITQLMGDGAEVVTFGQGFKDMTAPTKELLKLVTSGQLRHGGHPVLRWMAANLATETDAAGNLKPSKKKSTERIDGMVALTMALGRAMLREPAGKPSVEVW